MENETNFPPELLCANEGSVSFCEEGDKNQHFQPPPVNESPSLFNQQHSREIHNIHI